MKIFRILAFLIICLGAFSHVFGQSYDAQEFSKLFNKDAKSKKSRAYRVKSTTEVFDSQGSTLKRKVISVQEVVPPDRRSYVLTTESAGVTKRKEIIIIGEKRFVKEDGEWKIDDSKPEIGVAGKRGEERFIEKAVYDGQTVSVYEVKIEFPSSSATQRYWFDEEGNLLKNEYRGTNPKNNEILQTVSTYEYDPNIKIEAPVK